MSSEQTPEQKSLKYAEDLGLNSVYQDALRRREELSFKVLDLSGARDRKRSLESLKTDLEMAVVEEERGKFPDMSAAAMEKHLKVAYSNNADIREAKDEILALSSQIDLLEWEIDLLNTDIKIAVSRLNELGGYFQFMAVVKQAHEARKAKQSEERSGDPWK